MKHLIALMLIPSALWAGEFTLLEGDTALKRSEIMEMTARADVVFYDGGRSRYSTGGSYSYTYDGGAAAFGLFTVEQDGTICITYRNGRNRCDRFVHSHDRLVMLTQDGQRFAIKP